jgi:hypothetical protein
MHMSYKEDYAVFILTFLVLLIGISLIIASSLFFIFKIFSTPTEVLPYLLHATPSHFKWVYKYIILGIVLTIIELISLIYLIFFKRRNGAKPKEIK